MKNHSIAFPNWHGPWTSQLPVYFPYNTAPTTRDAYQVLGGHNFEETDPANSTADVFR